jgi:hypothetical protein
MRDLRAKSLLRAESVHGTTDLQHGLIHPADSFRDAGAEMSETIIIESWRA